MDDDDNNNKAERLYRWFSMALSFVWLCLVRLFRWFPANWYRSIKTSEGSDYGEDDSARDLHDHCDDNLVGFVAKEETREERETEDHDQSSDEGSDYGEDDAARDLHDHCDDNLVGFVAEEETREERGIEDYDESSDEGSDYGEDDAARDLHDHDSDDENLVGFVVEKEISRGYDVSLSKSTLSSGSGRDCVLLTFKNNKSAWERRPWTIWLPGYISENCLDSLENELLTLQGVSFPREAQQGPLPIHVAFASGCRFGPSEGEPPNNVLNLLTRILSKHRASIARLVLGEDMNPNHASEILSTVDSPNLRALTVLSCLDLAKLRDLSLEGLRSLEVLGAAGHSLQTLLMTQCRGTLKELKMTGPLFDTDRGSAEAALDAITQHQQEGLALEKLFIESSFIINNRSILPKFTKLVRNHDPQATDMGLSVRLVHSSDSGDDINRQLSNFITEIQNATPAYLEIFADRPQSACRILQAALSENRNGQPSTCKSLFLFCPGLFDSQGDYSAPAAEEFGGLNSAVHILEKRLPRCTLLRCLELGDPSQENVDKVDTTLRALSSNISLTGHIKLSIGVRFGQPEPKVLKLLLDRNKRFAQLKTMFGEDAQVAAGLLPLVLARLGVESETSVRGLASPIFWVLGSDITRWLPEKFIVGGSRKPSDKSRPGSDLSA